VIGITDNWQTVLKHMKYKNMGTFGKFKGKDFQHTANLSASQNDMKININ